MNLKNYTSGVSPQISMANIEAKLIEIGASNISKKYEDKICRGITFLIYDETLLQTIPFNIKAEVDECFKIFWKDVKRPKADTKERILDQANRTAWKILSDWTEIQCSMILLGQAKPLQMFLPFMYDIQKEETYYDKIISGKMQLQLT